jgi:DNA ligase 1
MREVFVKFHIVAQAFDVIEQVSSRLEMTRLLADLFKLAGPKEISIICNLSLGQLHPPYIGTQFALAEKTMVKVVAQLLQESDSDITRQAKKIGDLGAVVAERLWKTHEDPTVLQVYQVLCDIEETGGTGSQEEKINKLVKLLKTVDPISAKYIVRIIVGKLRMGFSDMTIVDALSWMEVGNKSLRDKIEDAYNVCADIGRIASLLKEKGIKAVEKMEIVVGIPIRPAAAERLPHASDIIKKIGNCVAQPKLDGFRLQIHVSKHKKKPEIHFFSRNLQDMSFMFPDLIPALEELEVEDLICEGEAIVFDPNTGIFLPFQETVKRKRKHGIEQAAEEFPLKVFIFDILYLNGKSLLDKTHEERRAIMLKIFKSVKSDLVQVIDEKPIHTAKDLENYFTSIIASGLEGLVVKRPDASYVPGKRNFNWIKLKRQETGHLEDTIDTVILGYYSGKGKRAQFGVGAFLVGVYDKNKDSFETVAKIGTGLKDEEWHDLKKRCNTLAIKHKPVNVICAKELEPDVWVSPELVCITRADEITLSPLHSAGKTKEHLGYALRFPRFMGYSLDKGPYEATTSHEIKRLYEDQFK